MGRHVDKHPEYLQPLYNLLVSYHQSECKDPRDRVFALLGLITSEERAFLSTYFPDYSMKEDHVRIITLAHLTQFPESVISRSGVPINITPDSKEVFLGLGVRFKGERRRLLQRAGELDYLGRVSREEMMDLLAFQDRMYEYGGEDLDEGRNVDEEQDMREGGRRWCSLKKWLTVCTLVIFVLLV